MRQRSSWLVLALGAACVCCFYVALRQRRELIRLRADNEAMATAEKRDQRELARLARQVKGFQLAEEARHRRAEQNRAAQQTLAAARRGSDRSVGVLRYSDIIKDHPEFAAIRDKEMRRNLIRQYGDAFAALNLTPDKLAQLKNLLIERQASSQDAQEAARSAGLQPGTPAYAQAMAQAYNDVQQQIVALIGTDGQKALQQSQQVSMIKNYQIPNNYAPDFTDAGVPLTPDQTQALAQALASNQGGNSPAQTPGYREPDPQTWLSQADQDTIARASQVLSPAQVDVFKADLAEQNQRNAIMQPYFRRANRGGGGTTVLLP